MKIVLRGDLVKIWSFGGHWLEIICQVVGKYQAGRHGGFQRLRPSSRQCLLRVNGMSSGKKCQEGESDGNYEMTMT
jgi:hypothetical protein